MSDNPVSIPRDEEPLACPQQVACPACPVCPPAKPAPETAFYEETAFNVLPGWSTNRAQRSLRTFIAKCRNEDGGYGVAPGQPSNLSGTYYAAIIRYWLDR